MHTGYTKGRILNMRESEIKIKDPIQNLDLKKNRVLEKNKFFFSVHKKTPFV